MEMNSGRKFEKPEAGQFAGTVIDVVDLPNYPSSFGPKNKIRIVWTLGPTTPGQNVMDSEGHPFQVIAMPNASMNEKATLFKMLCQILNQAPPLMTTTEQLAQLLIGRSNILFLTKTPNPKIQGDFFVNVAGIGPMIPGIPVPVAPQGFVRAKDRAKTTAGPNGQPVQTFAQPPTQPQPTQQPQFQAAPQFQPAGQPAPVTQAPPPNRVSW